MRAQNIYLQALALGLGTTEVGAFAGDQAPLAIMPIGRIG